MLAAIYPQSSFMTQIGANPDFYGPFWIPTTIIFLLFATSTVASSIDAAMNGVKTHVPVDIKLLSTAVSTVYAYVLAVPALIYVTGRYHKIDAISLFDLINVYGYINYSFFDCFRYGMTVWMPVTVVCVIPSEVFRLLMVVIAFCISSTILIVLLLTTLAFFLFRTIQPMSATLNNSTASSFIIGTVLVCQIGLAVIFKLWFLVANVKAKAP